jgi:tetratricopeptide (TPR) repeat protein
MLGRRAEAERALDALGRDAFSVLPFDQEWLYGMSLLAETSALLGDAGTAAVLYRLLYPWAGLNAADPPEVTRGSISRYLGLLSTTLGDHDHAATHYEHAIAINANIGAAPWLAHTQTDYARTLLARNAPGDRDHADELLNTALATYQDLDMYIYATQASTLADQVRAA